MLGGGIIEVLNGNEDLNDYRKGTFQANSGHSLVHAPNTHASMIWHTNWKNGYWGMQFYYDFTDTVLFIRIAYGSGYGTAKWKKFEGTIVE